jgi:hypothetical protein
MIAPFLVDLTPQSQTVFDTEADHYLLVFEGIMDELRIYNRALTDLEIQSLYKQP